MSAVQEEPELYNFSRAGHLTADQLHALQTMQEMVARNTSYTLSAWLRTQFLVSALPVQQKSFQAMLEDLPELSFTCSTRIEPAEQRGIYCMSIELAPPLVDVLLGGTGMAVPPRELTEIEESILTAVSEMVLKEWNKTWAVALLQISLDKREREGQLRRMLSAQEKVVLLPLDVTMPTARGLIWFALPAVLLSTVMRNMNNQQEEPRRQTEEWRQRMMQLLEQARVPLHLRMPRASLRTQQVSRMQPGDLLPLAIMDTQLAELSMRGIAPSLCSIVQVGEKRGARLVNTDAGLVAAETQPTVSRENAA